ncbi:MAG: aminotransferase [Defluviicoccus sp.]|nr:aminotransferase [Defluviicoccus sp.]
MKATNAALGSFGTTIFTVMSALAVEHGAINLGQGFPDEDGPEPVRRAAAEAILAGPNQYPPMAGLPILRQAVAQHAQRFYDLAVDWQTEVLVTSGATEALADCFFGLIEPGDEVVLIEPLYDAYLPLVLRAGGVPRLVRMTPPDWALPVAALEAAFSPRTKLLVLNSPNNPSGKVFTADELGFIAELAQRWDAYVVCDEVYEHLVFGGLRHIPLMTLPGMRERCVRIGSAGKTFSLTGWKVGMITAPPPLLSAIAKAHQFTTFTTVPALQIAVATGLGLDDSYFNGLARALEAKRDRLSRGLEAAGLPVLPAQGTYFLTVDVGAAGFNGTDEAFCRTITEAAGVAAVPVSAFYADTPPAGFARFCFCKRDEVLDEASRRLGRYFGRA